MSIATTALPVVTSLAASDDLLVNASGATSRITEANAKTSLGVPSAANPTASAGLTAVNGSASTFLRSDGAPAISQSIAPTWTGQHAFSGHFINALGGLNLSGDGSFGPKMPSWSGGNGFSVISQSGTVSYIEFDSQQLCRIASGYISLGAGGPSVPGTDVAVARASAGVVEVNNGTLGTLRDLNARNVSVNGSASVPVTFSLAGVNLKTVAANDIFTVPAGKTFILLDCFVLITAATAATVGWAAGPIESGAGAAMMAAVATTQSGSANAAGLYYPHARNNAAGTVAYTQCTAGNKVQYNVTTGATATTLTGTVIVTGFFI